MKQLNKYKSILTDLIFYLSILFFIIGFNFSDNMVNGWYQQFMPNLNGRSITDIFFLDSLTGWSVTNATNQNPDTTYVLKTTNSGDNWAIQYRKIQTGGGFPGYFRVYFLNQNTGYTCGVKGIDKSTDGGLSWTSLNAPLNSYLDISVLNIDTIWLVSTNSLTGGVFRTTNSGINWDQQLSQGAANPDKIYMFNARIGYANRNGGSFMYNTTNSGLNWAPVAGTDGFSDIYFTDSLTGWKSLDSVYKTTNGGLNWKAQVLPYGGFNGGFLNYSYIFEFSNINKDTLWGVGGRIAYPNTQLRGLIYITTNGGNNWLFQLPDTSIHMPQYVYLEFVNKLNGWAYGNNGVHTISGGDTISYTNIKKLNEQIPIEYKLYQNYPNPFNPSTIIKYGIKKQSYIKLTVYDITGREIAILINNDQNAEIYEVTFDGTNYSSGIYFYSLFADGILIDTKRMILLK